MIYRPAKGAMWDPSILCHGGRYYSFMMYNTDGDNGLEAGHCLLAVSDDGVRWRDEGVVIAERELERGCKFFKCMVARCGDRLILNHGVMRPEGQDTLRFYESRDLLEWSYLFSNRPDPRWYGLPPGPNRWDHMYMLPKDDGDPGAGYWGYPVAVAKSGDPRGIGMMQSSDGVTWEVLPPAMVEWGDIPPADLEWGGCERFGGKYYLIGGGFHMGFKGYGMFVLVADDPRGPFRPVAGTFRLSGNSEHNIGWLAVWCRGNGELLISNYASPFPAVFGQGMPGAFSPWLLPLRKPVLDAGGHLRLGWWKGNETLKGKPLALSMTSIMLDGAKGYDSLYLTDTFNPDQGVVIEGIIRVREAGGASNSATRPAVGFMLDEGDGVAMATLLDVGKPDGRETNIGRLQTANGSFSFTVMDTTGKHCATVTGIEYGVEHTFRLLSRTSLFELYIDDLLVQTFFYKPGAGRIGFAVCNATAEYGSLRAWEMLLPETGIIP